MKRVVALSIVGILGCGQLGAQNAFITTWKTDNAGYSNSTSITIPTDSSSYTYNYDVDWDNDGVFDEFGLVDSVTHDFGVAGTYTIRIQGIFPKIDFRNGGDELKIIDVSQWGDIQWWNMVSAFQGCANLNFTAVDAPDLSLVTNMRMFLSRCTSFNSDIEHWDVSNVDDFHRGMEYCEVFNQPMEGWDMSSATNIDRLFQHCYVFNQPLNNWDVSKVTTMAEAFGSATSFNQPLDNWDVSSVVHFSGMFAGATSFNQDISGWNTANASQFARMFSGATAFNQPIGTWNISKAASLFAMFQNATSFNQPLNTWNTSNVTNAERAFANADAFNQPLDNWDMSNATRLARMFEHTAVFNQDLSSWDVSNVQYMNSMFRSTVAFNGDISNWDVSSAQYMNSMFEDSKAFLQNLSNWDISSATTLERMFNGTGLTTAIYDSMLIAWNALPVQNNVLFGAGNSIYCRAWAERDSLINDHAWVITDAGAETNPPTALCRDTTLYLIPIDTFNLTAIMLDSGSTDDCTDLIYSISQTVFTCDDIGVIEDTLTVTDRNGNSATCISNVTVLDTTVNLFKTCTSDMLINTNNDSCTAVATWTAPVVRCDIVSITSTHQPGDTFALGTTTVTYIAENHLSVTDTCRFNVTVVNDLSMTVDSSSNPSCSDVADGQAFITVSGGNTPYTFDWSNDGVGDYDDNEDQTGFMSGTYYIVVQDSVGCTTNDSISISTNSSAFTTCPSDTTLRANTASCKAIVNFDTPTTVCSETALTFNYQPGDTFDIGTTTVTYTSTDSLSNMSVCSFDITVFNDLALTVDSSSSPTCSDSADGQAFITVGGGATPYTYDWSHDGTGDNDDLEDQTGLMSGTYYVSVQDTAGCTVNDSITLTTNSSTFATCPDDTTLRANAASCRAIVNFDTPTTVCTETALIFNYQPGDTFNIGTTAVTYTSTDSLSNVSVCSFDITVFNDLALAVDSSSSPTCSDSTNGQAFITLTGGASPYTYDWSHDGTGDNDDVEDQTGLMSGTYYVSVQDTAGCSVNDSITLTTNSSNFATCPGDTILRANAASCKAIVNFDTPTTVCSETALTFNYQPGDTFNIGTTTVTYTSTDSLSNVSTCSFDVTVFSDFSFSIDSSISPTCSDSTNGQVFISLSGGSEPYTYDWSFDGTGDFDDDEDQSGLTSGWYSVAVSDSAGCTLMDSITISTNSSGLTSCPTDTTVNTNSSGCAAIVNWTGPFLVCNEARLESNFQAGDTFNIGTTTVNYIATDSLGNTSTCSFDVTVVNDLDVQIDSVTYTDSAQAWIYSSIAGGASPYVTSWDFEGVGTGLDSLNILVSEEGNYQILINDANGCTDTATVLIDSIVVINDSTEAIIPNIFTPNGDGINDVFILPDEYKDAKELRIYNRWGQMILYSDAPISIWDGRTYSGVKVPDGHYFYTIITKNDKILLGQITILR